MRFNYRTLIVWLFIAVLGMGLFGLGLSTSISYFSFCLIQALYYFSGKSMLRFDLSSIRISVPSASPASGRPL